MFWLFQFALGAPPTVDTTNACVGGDVAACQSALYQNSFGWTQGLTGMSPLSDHHKEAAERLLLQPKIDTVFACQEGDLQACRRLGDPGQRAACLFLPEEELCTLSSPLQHPAALTSWPTPRAAQSVEGISWLYSPPKAQIAGPWFRVNEEGEGQSLSWPGGVCDVDERDQMLVMAAGVNCSELIITKSDEALPDELSVRAPFRVHTLRTDANFVAIQGRDKVALFTIEGQLKWDASLMPNEQLLGVFGPRLLVQGKTQARWIENGATLSDPIPGTCAASANNVICLSTDRSSLLLVNPHTLSSVQRPLEKRALRSEIHISIDGRVIQLALEGRKRKQAAKKNLFVDVPIDEGATWPKEPRREPPFDDPAVLRPPRTLRLRTKANEPVVLYAKGGLHTEAPEFGTLQDTPVAHATADKAGWAIFEGLNSSLVYGVDQRSGARQWLPRTALPADATAAPAARQGATVMVTDEQGKPAADVVVWANGRAVVTNSKGVARIDRTQDPLYAFKGDHHAMGALGHTMVLIPGRPECTVTTQFSRFSATGYCDALPTVVPPQYHDHLLQRTAEGFMVLNKNRLRTPSSASLSAPLVVVSDENLTQVAEDSSFHGIKPGLIKVYGAGGLPNQLWCAELEISTGSSHSVELEPCPEPTVERVLTTSHGKPAAGVPVEYEHFPSGLSLSTTSDLLGKVVFHGDPVNTNLILDGDYPANDLTIKSSRREPALLGGKALKIKQKPEKWWLKHDTRDHLQGRWTGDGVEVEVGKDNIVVRRTGERGGHRYVLHSRWPSGAKAMSRGADSTLWLNMADPKVLVLDGAETGILVRAK